MRRSRLSATHIAERHDHQRHVLLDEQRQHDEHDVHPSTAFERGRRSPSRRTRRGTRRGGSSRGSSSRPPGGAGRRWRSTSAIHSELEPPAGVEEHRDRRRPDRQRLGEEHRAGGREQPVERNEQHSMNDVWSPNRLRPISVTNGAVEPRHQPHALVVQPGVVARRPEPVVDVEGPLREVHDVERDAHDEHELPAGDPSPPRDVRPSAGVGRRRSRSSMDVRRSSTVPRSTGSPCATSTFAAHRRRSARRCRGARGRAPTAHR